MSNVKVLLYDCERFVRQFFLALGSSSLQVYHSALLFTPRETLFYKTYGREQMPAIKIYNAVGRTWDLCMRTMEGHTSVVSSVAFSPDGTRVVSGSLDN